MPDVVSLIRIKRDNTRPLTDREIGWLFAAYASGDVADEQMAALLMAIYFNGLDGGRAQGLDGGDDRLRRAAGPLGRLAAAPRWTSTPPAASATRCRWCSRRWWRAAARSCRMLSGRGLGHTGGTLDKLESIPGWRASLSNEELTAALRSVGAVIAAAGSGLAPADRRLYALRDVTGNGRVDPADRQLDHVQEDRGGNQRARARRQDRVRRLHGRPGAGARPRPHHGRASARSTASAPGRSSPAWTRRSAAPSAMPSRSRRPSRRCRARARADLMEVTFALARQMLELAGLDADPRQAIASGRALDTFKEMVKAQGGDPDAPLPQAAHRQGALPAPAAGWVTRLDARAVGVAAWRLARAGRARKTASVTRRASAAWRSRATTSGGASTCLSCTPTTPPASPRRSRRSRAR